MTKKIKVKIGSDEKYPDYYISRDEESMFHLPEEVVEKYELMRKLEREIWSTLSDLDDVADEMNGALYVIKRPETHTGNHVANAKHKYETARIRALQLGFLVN